MALVAVVLAIPIHQTTALLPGTLFLQEYGFTNRQAESLARKLGKNSISAEVYVSKLEELQLSKEQARIESSLLPPILLKLLQFLKDLLLLYIVDSLCRDHIPAGLAMALREGGRLVPSPQILLQLWRGPAVGA